MLPSKFKTRSSDMLTKEAGSENFSQTDLKRLSASEKYQVKHFVEQWSLVCFGCFSVALWLLQLLGLYINMEGGEDAHLLVNCSFNTSTPPHSNSVWSEEE